MLPLEAAIAPSMKAAGFRKKARTWWRDGDETIQVFNIQKSPFGESLYANLGIYVKRLGSEGSPPQNRCHVQARLERASEPGHARAVAAATSSAPPTKELLDAVLVDGLAWLDRLSTLAGIRHYVEGGGANRGLVFASVRELVADPK